MNPAPGQGQPGQGQPGQGQGPPPTPQEIQQAVDTAEANITLLNENFNTPNSGFERIITNATEINQYLTTIFTQINNIIALLQNIDDSDEFNRTIFQLYAMIQRYNEVVANSNINDKHNRIASQVNGINELLRSHIFVFILNNGANNNKFQKASQLFNGDYQLGNADNYVNGRNNQLQYTPANQSYTFNGNIVANPVNGQPNNFEFTYDGDNYVAQIYKFNTPNIVIRGGGAKRKRRRTRKNKRKSKAKKQKGGFGYNNKVPSSSKKKTSKRRTSSRTSSTTSTSSSK
jgi:hypothetical protein